MELEIVPRGVPEEKEGKDYRKRGARNHRGRKREKFRECSGRLAGNGSG